MGFRPLERAEANPFFRLVAARCERGSIVTSNMHAHDLPEVFAGDGNMMTGILDRLLHLVLAGHIDTRSQRLRVLDTPLE